MSSLTPGKVGKRGARRCFLTAVGDANDPVTWSGILYHFLQAAKREGLVDEGLPLELNGLPWRLRRWFWNATRMLLGDRLGGYQYSIPFLETLWAPYRTLVSGAILIHCFQLYPPSVVADSSIEKWFFLDQTLLQLFDHYGIRPSVGRHVAAEAVERERKGYYASSGVVVHSSWAAESVKSDYGVPASKVHVVLPGANLDAALYSRWEQEEEERRADPTRSLEPSGPVRFVFVGKDWRRKGLDRLLRGFALANDQGAGAKLRVIGCRRQSLPVGLRSTSGVQWSGFVDKRARAQELLRMVAECDVGCLLSRAEAGGIAIREYHALGLAVLGTTAGGAGEHACPEASWFLPPEAADEVIAEAFLDICRARDRLAVAKEEAWKRRHSFLQRTTVGKVVQLIGEASRSGS